jgi:hypothetical protein
MYQAIAVVVLIVVVLVAYMVYREKKFDKTVTSVAAGVAANTFMIEKFIRKNAPGGEGKNAYLATQGLHNVAARISRAAPLSLREAMRGAEELALGIALTFNELGDLGTVIKFTKATRATYNKYLNLLDGYFKALKNTL